MNKYILKDLLEIKNGKDHKHLSDGSIPVYGSGGVMRSDNNSIYDDESILLPRKGTLNNIQYVNKPFWTVDTIYYTIVNKEKANPYYLYNYLRLLDLSTLNSGTGVPSMTFGAYYDVEVKLPDLNTQTQLAKVLSDLDAKIELNNKINAELEAMAKLIYDYWFVQFDFPISKEQAKSMGKPELEGKPYKSSGGKMVWNEELKREIPAGWEVKELSEIANITMGQSPSGSSYNEIGEGDIFFQGSTDFGWRFPKIRQYTTEPSRIAEQGDVLLSVRAPVGTLNVADNRCCIGRGLAALNSKDDATSYLFYVMVYFKQIFDRRNTSGTTFGSITKDDLFSLKTIYPTKNILKEYDNIVSVYNEKIYNNHKQNLELSELRDWLLPMLMNGQVKVGAYNSKKIEQSLNMAAEASPAYKKPRKVSSKQIENYKKIQVLYSVISANKQINVKQGEMATAKDVYLLDRISGIDTGFQFAQNNWGAFDPKEKQLLNTKQYFYKPKFPNSKAFYLDLKDNGKLLDKIPEELKSQVSQGIQLMNDKVFKSYFGTQKATKKELFATILKCIEDKQTLELPRIRTAMENWKIKQKNTKWTNKAEKFSEEETKEALDIIVEENWYVNVFS